MGVHRAERPLEHCIPEERLGEIDTRYVDAMLERLADLDPRPLWSAREPAQRLVGWCRDLHS